MQEPLTPAGCSLTDFPFMPIMIQRLKQSRSWLLCKRNPALAFYLLNIWTAAWHSTPAGSLENDDMVLADAAMCDEATFAALRADIMRGWVECSDDRLYHPVVAEQVIIAWEKKQAQRARTSAATAARLARQKERDDARNVQRREDVLGQRESDVTFTKGQGQGQGQKERERGGTNAANPPPPPASDPSAQSKPSRGRPAKAKAGWPEGFELTPEMAAHASKAGFDPPALFERFRDKALANGWTYSDWAAAFRNFAATQHKYAPAPPRSNGAWRPPDC